MQSTGLFCGYPRSLSSRQQAFALALGSQLYWLPVRGGLGAAVICQGDWGPELTPLRRYPTFSCFYFFWAGSLLLSFFFLFSFLAFVLGGLLRTRLTSTGIALSAGGGGERPTWLAINVEGIVGCTEVNPIVLVVILLAIQSCTLPTLYTHRPHTTDQSSVRLRAASFITVVALQVTIPCALPSRTPPLPTTSSFPSRSHHFPCLLSRHPIPPILILRLLSSSSSSSRRSSSSPNTHSPVIDHYPGSRWAFMPSGLGTEPHLASHKSPSINVQLGHPAFPPHCKTAAAA